MSNRSSPRGDRPNSTFITEMGNFKRSSNLNRTGRRNYNANSINKKKSTLPRISGSQSMYATTFGRTGLAAEIEFDQSKLDHIYELLVKEIMDLKRDIHPIRHNFLKLKDRLLFQRQCLVNSNENFLLSEQLPDLAKAIGEGGTFSGLIEEFQIEIDDNTNMINELKNRFSSYWVVKLSCENDKDRDELMMMKEMLKNLKSQKKKLSSNLLKLKQSENIVRIDNQRKQMHKLILNIAKAEQRNQKLLQSVEGLEKELDLNSTSPLPDQIQNTEPTNQQTNKVTFIINDSNKNSNIDDNSNNSNNDNNNNNNNQNDNINTNKYVCNFMNTPEAQAAFDEVEALEKELALKKQLYLKKCDELIVLRNSQLQQLQKYEKKLNTEQNNNQNNTNNNEEKKFHVKEPKKPPTTSGRTRKAINSPQRPKPNKKEEKTTTKKEKEESIENRASKMSSEELMNHLMSYSDKTKTDAEELQEIPLENDDDDEGGGIKIDDES